jgi:hypothetical protein
MEMRGGEVLEKDWESNVGNGENNDGEWATFSSKKSNNRKKNIQKRNEIPSLTLLPKDLIKQVAISLRLRDFVALFKTCKKCAEALR